MPVTPASGGPRPPMPATVKELWDTCWIADTEAEAVAQAERMYDLFAGRRVEVDRLWPADGADELDFAEPWPTVWVRELSTERGWDGDVLYPEWVVTPDDPDQVVTTLDGRRHRMGDLAANYPLTTTAPGIGTARGFAGGSRPFIHPEPVNA